MNPTTTSMLTSCAMDRVKRLLSAGERGDLFDTRRAGQHVVLGRAPGRLDVMGGIVDYTGSRVCQLPLAIGAVAAVQKRHDGQILCASAQEPNTVQLPLHQIVQVDALALREKLGAPNSWAGYLVGCVWWLFKHHPDAVKIALNGGVSIYVDSDVPMGAGVSSSAAIEVATMTALLTLTSITLTPMRLAAACQQVENQVVGAPCGVMDQVVSCMGRKGAMLEILCQPASDGSPAQVIGPLAIPAGYALVGIHSGVRHEVRGDPYTDTRVAAFMALKLLRHNHQGQDKPECLAQWAMYQNTPQLWQTLRTVLPEQITGRTFIEHFGHTDDPVTSIDPSRDYHVRAAADHHVLEMDRVTRFVWLLRQKPFTADVITKAGQLMNQSHESYTRCARLGHPLTNQLATMLLSALPSKGQERGIFGCRITGGGCGGTLALLIRDEPHVFETIESLRRQYEVSTGRTTMFFEDTSDGAIHQPALRW